MPPTASGSSPGWTSTTGRSTTCSARPRRWPSASDGKIDALGGVEHVILNPVDWDPSMLERIATDVLPLVRA